MAIDKKRINFKIHLPSIAFNQFLRGVVFEEKNFKLFMENPEGLLRAHGVKPDLTRKAIVDLKFTVVRIRDFVLQENVTLANFEEVFGIVEVGPPVGYSEEQSTNNRGTNQNFQNGAVETSSTNHYQTVNFSGIEFGPPVFIEVPLLDIGTLSSLVAQFNIRLQQFGNY